MNRRCVKAIKEMVDYVDKMEGAGNSAFISVSGHVAKVEFRGYAGEWRDGKEPIISAAFYYSGELYRKETADREMRRIHNAVKVLCGGRK